MKINFYFITLLIVFAHIMSCNTIRFSSKNKTESYATDTTLITVSYGKKIFRYDKETIDSVLKWDWDKIKAWDLKQVFHHNKISKKGTLNIYLIENDSLTGIIKDSVLFFTATTYKRRLQGEAFSYSNPDGKNISAKRFYVKGKMDGLETLYHPSGSVSSIKLYKKGKLKIDYEVSPPNEKN